LLIDCALSVRKETTMGQYPLTLKSVESSETIEAHLTKRHAEILEKVREISGIDVFRCIQCGCCSAGCPVADWMDYTPAQMMKLLQVGDFPELAKASTVATCASCFACLARCPRGIDIAGVAEAVRQVFIRKREDYHNPSTVPQDTLRKIPQIALIGCFRKFSS
jgi:heterodisulfide reductase subunit C